MERQMSTSTPRRFSAGVLVFSVGLLLAALFFFMTGNPEDKPEPTLIGKPPTLTATATLAATITATPTISPTASLTLFPTAAPELVNTSVSLAVEPVGVDEIERAADAYTIVDDQARARIIKYTVKRGDSLRDIAAYFDLSIETIIWSNERFYVNAMRPGLELTILPFEGAIHHVQTPTTIQALAEEYEVQPEAIIDSDFNELDGADPQAVLPVGLAVVIPGGTGSLEPIYWEPTGGASTSGELRFGEYQGTAKFGPGQPGSCGVQEVYGGTMPIFKPVSGYKLTTDYSWNHQGLDLSQRMGTPVYATGGGTVIFAGWSDWGYGYAIVIAHGPLMSLYAHLTGAGVVWCGQQVEAGQYIGNVGSSGRSRGPHLHFEIRNSAGVPQNPRDYLTF